METTAERYRLFFENAVEGMYQTSPEGCYLMANRALARIYGYDSVEAFQEGVRDVASQIYVDPQRRAQIREKLGRDGILQEEESQVRRRDGAIIWICENMREVRQASGALLYYEGTVIDVTIRKEMDASRRKKLKHREETEKRFRSFIENAVLGVYQTSPTGGYLMVNKALADIYGYASVETFLAEVQDVASQIYVDPRRREQLRATLKDQGLLRNEESEVRRQDGTVIRISESMREVRDEEDRLLYYEGLVADITQRQQP